MPLFRQPGMGEALPSLRFFTAAIMDDVLVVMIPKVHSQHGNERSKLLANLHRKLRARLGAAGQGLNSSPTIWIRLDCIEDFLEFECRCPQSRKNRLIHYKFRMAVCGSYRWHQSRCRIDFKQEKPLMRSRELSSWLEYGWYEGDLLRFSANFADIFIQGLF